MLRVDDPNGDWEDAMPLATDIGTIQPEYGIDTGPTVGAMPGRMVWWISGDDPRNAGDCSVGGMSEREVQARITAIRIAVVARTRQ